MVFMHQQCHGLEMIEHVRRRALLCKLFDEVYVATDDKEIANIAMKLMRHKTNLQYKKKRKGDSQFLVCDIKKAKKILGWKPQKSTIKNIILNEIYWNKYLLKKNVSRV